MSIAEKLQTIAENEQKVYDAGFEKGKSQGGNTEETYNNGFEAGKKSEYDAFWDSLQDNGNRIHYGKAFVSWKKDIFKPKYDFNNVADASYMFEGAKIGDLKAILSSRGLKFNTSNCINFSYMFLSSDVTNIPYLDCSQTSALSGMFQNCMWLTTIDELKLKEDGSQTFGNTFLNCNSLANIKISGCIGNNFSIINWVLSLESITSIINALSDTTSGKTLSLSKKSVQNAFGTTDLDSSTEWTTLKNSKSNWTITLS